MRVMTLQAPMGFDHITEEEREIPSPGAGEILVRVHASSLNYHDYLIARGIRHSEGLVLMSDGSGEVIEVGEGVTEFRVGDHVISTFFPDWLSGDPDARFSGVAGGSMAAVPGDTIDGFAAEYVAKPATSFTKAPKGYTHPEAATLVCAGLTAWRGLIVEGQVKQGDTVLVGHWGCFYLCTSVCKGAGATVIATSSSNEKLERLKAMGADHVINYKETPDWGVEARKLTGGLGVDHVIEIGGAGTPHSRSLRHEWVAILHSLAWLGIHWRSARCGNLCIADSHYGYYRGNTCTAGGYGSCHRRLRHEADRG